MSEQLPLFEMADDGSPEQLMFDRVTEPLGEEDDSFGRAIGWNELAEQFGWEPQMFDQTEETMSPLPESDDGAPEDYM